MCLTTILTDITFAYTFAREDITGFSRFYFLFGREPAFFIEYLLCFPPSPHLAEATIDAICRARDARQLACLSTLDLHELQRARYDDS